MPRRYLLAALLFVSGLSGCSRDAGVVGRWDCNTLHPGEHRTQDIFQFFDDGKMSLSSEEFEMFGHYTRQEMQLTMVIDDMPVPLGAGPAPIQRQTLTAAIKSLSDEKMEMDISTGNERHLSYCYRNQ